MGLKLMGLAIYGPSSDNCGKDAKLTVWRISMFVASIGLPKIPHKWIYIALNYQAHGQGRSLVIESSFKPNMCRSMENLL